MSQRILPANGLMMNAGGVGSGGGGGGAHGEYSEWKKLMDSMGNKANYSVGGVGVTRRAFDYSSKSSRQPPITMAAYLPNKVNNIPATHMWKKEEVLNPDSSLMKYLKNKMADSNNEEDLYQRKQMIKRQEYFTKNVDRNPEKRFYMAHEQPDLNISAAKRSRMTTDSNTNQLKRETVRVGQDHNNTDTRKVPTFMAKQKLYSESGYNNRTIQKRLGNLNSNGNAKFEFAIGELKKNNRAFKQEPLDY